MANEHSGHGVVCGCGVVCVGVLAHGMSSKLVGSVVQAWAGLPNEKSTTIKKINSDIGYLQIMRKVYRAVQ